MRDHPESLPIIPKPVGVGNFDSNRREIKYIVMHTIVGTIAGASAKFARDNIQSSAHYGIGLDGKYYQWVSERLVAYHAGHYEINQQSIGIEHEDGYNPQTNPLAYDQPRPDALYEASARLVADIAKYYNIPLDRQHIVMHREVSKKATHCPGTFDIDRVIQMAKTQAGEEVLMTYKMPESVFLGMVTKSTNFDDLLTGIRDTLPDPLRGLSGTNTQAGELLTDYIKQLQTDFNNLKIQYDDARSPQEGSSELLDSLLGRGGTNTPPGAIASDSIAPPIPVLTTPNVTLDEYSKVKGWFMADLKDVFSRMFRAIFG